jgi:hypothetical protein
LAAVKISLIASIVSHLILPKFFDYFTIVEVNRFIFQNLIVFMPFSGYKDDVLRLGHLKSETDCFFPVRNHMYFLAFGVFPKASDDLSIITAVL